MEVMMRRLFLHNDASDNGPLQSNSNLVLQED